MKSIALTLCVIFSSACVFAGPNLRVVDEQGQPVKQFEFMIHTANDGYSRWMKGADGAADASDVQSYQRATAIDVLVRADGFASATKSFQDDELKKLRGDGASITLPRGDEIRLRLKTAEGIQLPEGLLPQLYFPQYGWRVRAMWQPENARHAADSDFNMLNVRPAGKGEFVFRYPMPMGGFMLAIHHPGWLRFFEMDPFENGEIRDDVLTIDVPRPIKLEARFDLAGADRAAVPFDQLTFSVAWNVPEMAGDSYLSVATEKKMLDDPKYSIGDLAPGNYMVRMQTSPAKLEGVREVPDANRAAYFADVQHIQLAPGEKSEVNFTYVPYDPEAYRGTRTAAISVLNQDGSPAVGKKVKISYFDGHYGMLTVHEGTVADDGIVRLENVTDRMPTTTDRNPYTIEINGQTLGSFRIARVDELQKFEYRVSPQVGDRAPDIALVEARTGETSRLADYRGRVVFLEFWATWCGPCQPAMEKLNGLADNNRDAWKEAVAVVPVSVDDRRELVLPHVDSRGWTNLPHFWSGEGKEVAFFNSPAAQAYGVNGIPTALLIDREGKIVWRGHPSSFDLAERVKEFLPPNTNE
ncbi:MAG: TlpA disulfide reductase family protein [Pirellulales bacterium]